METSAQKEDPLQFFPIERWGELEATFEADWPRGISALTALRTQRELEARGLGYGFKVYCPYGLASNGMVAFNTKGQLNEIIIQCPNNDTRYLETCLVNTKLIDWSKTILIPYMPNNIVECITKVAELVNVTIEAEDSVANDVFIQRKRKFEVYSLPNDTTFKRIAEEDISLVDSSWRNRHNGSDWLFRMLVKANFGFGIYKEENLVSWVFNNEVGALTHLFTPEIHRRKGYAHELMKRFCNSMEEDKTLFAYCRKGNNACKLYNNLGFEKYHEGIFNEIMVQCPKDDTNAVEEALSKTKLIDWTKSYQIPCLPNHVFECIQRVAVDVNMNHVVDHNAYLVLYEANQQLLEDIRLPDGVTFQLIREEYIDMVNDAWPPRYEGSEWVFQFLVKAQTAYGLFRNKELLCCVFISELGAILHLYTFENHRRKGYARIILTLIGNKLLKQKRDIFFYCDVNNVGALRLYENMGFRLLHFLKWSSLTPIYYWPKKGLLKCGTYT